MQVQVAFIFCPPVGRWQANSVYGLPQGQRCGSSQHCSKAMQLLGFFSIQIFEKSTFTRSATLMQVQVAFIFCPSFGELQAYDLYGLPEGQFCQSSQHRSKAMQLVAFFSIQNLEKSTFIQPLCTIVTRAIVVTSATIIIDFIFRRQRKRCEIWEKFGIVMALRSSHLI